MAPAAAARGHPLNAAFTAWVVAASASDPEGDWSVAVAAYLAHCDALFAEAERSGAAAKAAGSPPAAKKAASPGSAEAGGEKAAGGFFFGKCAAEQPASREANPFAQRLDFGNEARMHRSAGDARQQTLTRGPSSQNRRLRRRRLPQRRSWRSALPARLRTARAPRRRRRRRRA